ncbi:putative ABC transporter permease [Paucilactobacillus suebicus]|uniref:ABC transporter permease n=1 Tax=Paucilactobacillus suebicus DSM 5007 = KCTC 3549 TaxID=1423807 RepID=A0A0R1VYE4_9LACO|nr:putative ABC transporter permease [Paucilactobacillus suebicus]KRM10567.1 hypothetical protein FD16_GL001169 [Paucilactobacillus suebicus DSM 5007 = KCTC 3549]
MAHQIEIINLEEEFAVWVLYFFAYSVVGWLWESSYVSVRKRKWTNSGFLIGPVVPVYGFSMMAVLAVVEPFEKNIAMLFVMSAILITMIEYVTSWLMEKLFHARWWDYSKIPLNLNGRVALPISLFWGFGVVIIIKFIHPVISKIVVHFSTNYGIFAGILLIAIIMFDFGFTIANAMAFGAATNRIGETVESMKAELKTRVADEGSRIEAERSWVDYRAHDKQGRLPHLNYVQRRLLKSFPNVKLRDTATSANDISTMADLIKERGKKAKSDK